LTNKPGGLILRLNLPAQRLRLIVKGRLHFGTTGERSAEEH
jgi:hypothetical protein